MQTKKLHYHHFWLNSLGNMKQSIPQNVSFIFCSQCFETRKTLMLSYFLIKIACTAGHPCFGPNKSKHQILGLENPDCPHSHQTIPNSR